MREALLVLLLVGCAGDDVDTDALDTDPVDTDVEDIDTDTEADPCAPYTWDTVGGPFLRTWCTGCHGSGVRGAARSGAPEGVDLDSADAAGTWLGRIEVRVLDQGDMPPGGGPSARELEELESWLACEEG